MREKAKLSKGLGKRALCAKKRKIQLACPKKKGAGLKKNDRGWGGKKLITDQIRRE